MALMVVTKTVTLRSESNLALKDAVRVMPGGRGECGARGRGLISLAPGRSGHHACRHYDRCARCVAGSGQAVGGVTPAPWTAWSTKPGPDRTKGPHTPWEEPWWNAGRRARPKAEGRRKPSFRGATAPVWCGTDDSAFAGVPLPLFLSSLRGAKRRSNPGPCRCTGLLRFARNDAGTYRCLTSLARRSRRGNRIVIRPHESGGGGPPCAAGW